MRPLKLTMTSFGPYRDTETVDFEKLKGRNLFLITGPTGAGKTTIFDAITYALYGSGNGDERKSQNFRSDFADRDKVTGVEFEFSLGGKLYRIVRNPAQPVKKKRGDGYREESEKVMLTYKNQNGEAVVHDKIKEANEEIERILNLSVKQFRQIMMIPQGQFREVITSDTSAREEILRALFDTERYGKVQEALKERKKELEQSIKGSLSYIGDELKKIDKYDEGETTESILTNIERDIESFVSEIALKDGEIERINEKLKEIGAEIVRGKQNNRLLENIQKTRETLALLENRSEEYVQKSDKLKKIEKSLRIVGEEKNCKELEDKLLNLEQELKDGRKKLEYLKSDLEQKAKALSLEKKREDERNAFQQRIANLKEYKDEFREFSLNESGLEKEKFEYETTLKRLREQELEVLKKTEEIESLEHEIENGGKYSLELERIERRKQILEQERLELIKAYKLKKDIDDCCKVMKKAEKALAEKDGIVEKLELDLKRAEREHSELYELFLSEQSAYIAEMLIDGEPCPVCGSIHHPNPSRRWKSDVSQEDLKSKKTIAEEKRKALDMAKSKRNTAEGEWNITKASIENKRSILAEKLGEIEIGEADIESSGFKKRDEIGECDKKIAELEKSVEKLERSKTELKKLKIEREKLNECLKIDSEKERSLSDKIKELELKLQNKRISLEKLLCDTDIGYEKFKTVVECLEKKHIVLVESYRVAEEGYRNTENSILRLESVIETKNLERLDVKLNLERKLSEFNYSLIKLGFRDVQEYRDHKVTEVELEGLAKDIDAYYDEIKNLKSIIEADEKSVDIREVVDIESLKKSEREEEIYREKISAEKMELVSRLDRYRESFESISKKLEEIGEDEKEYRIAGELSSVANAEKGGINKKNMSFERYVLSSFLEDILVATNRRFKNMTDGRFEIARKEGLDHKGKAGGLDLEIMDYYTGSKRDITTLSGGEGFKASLSMALGLSDVVKSHAGGIELDTIFIDEGFGTLDSDSLEVAIDTLRELQSSGRLVGIISHVDELKERIEAKIEITVSKYGSEILDFRGGECV